MSRWYEKPWVIVIALILFFPLGPFLMWRWAPWSSRAKWVVSGVVGVLVLTSAASQPQEENDEAATSRTSVPIEEQVPLVTTTTELATTTLPPTTLPPTTAPPPPPTTRRAPITTGATAGSGCHPSYSGACIPAEASDVDCAGGSGNGPVYTSAKRFRVVGPDEYELDGNDNDGIACET